MGADYTLLDPKTKIIFISYDSYEGTMKKGDVTIPQKENRFSKCGFGRHWQFI